MTHDADAYGRDSYILVAGQRVLIGQTRTLRPAVGEASAAFQRRVADLIQAVIARAPEGVLTIDEDVRDGKLVQVCVEVTLPTPRREPRP